MAAALVLPHQAISMHLQHWFIICCCGAILGKLVHFNLNRLRTKRIKTPQPCNGRGPTYLWPGCTCTSYYARVMYMYILHICQGNVHLYIIYYGRVMYMYILHICQGNVHVYIIYYARVMYMYILLFHDNAHVHPIYYASVMYMYILLCQGNVHVHPIYYARVMYMYIPYIMPV